MADILCPNCGRSNPDDLENCTYCQASLADAAPVPDDDADDWISSLRSDDDIYSEEEDQIDWPAPEDDSPTGAVEAERLERIASGPLGESPSDPDSLPELPVDATASQDQPEWLQVLMQSSSDEPAEPEPAPEPATGDDEAVVPASEFPDWLTELNEPEITGEGLQDEPEDEAAPEPLPDWLAALGAADLVEEFETLEPPQPPSAGSSMAEELDAGDPDETTGAEPEWLAGFIDESGTTAPVVELPDEDAPDWLAGFLDDSARPEEDEPEPFLPGRLTEYQEPLREAAPAEPEDDLPPWMGEFDTEPGRLDAAGAFEEMGFDEGPSFEEEAASIEEAERFESFEDEAGPGSASEEVPDWLASALGQVDVDSEAELPINPGSFEADEPGEELEADSDLQEWLSKYDRKTGPDDEPGPEPESDADVPDWLKEVNRVKGGGTEDTGDEEIPDWLRDLNEQETEFEMEGESPEAGEPGDEPDAIDWMPTGVESAAFSLLSEAEGIEEDLAPGELPEWLRAMRPIDATAPGVMETGESDTGSFERVGPLAGLRGVLSAEPSAAQAGRPPSHSVRLQVSDVQQSKANQLQKMVLGETEPRPASRRAILTEQRVLRYLIAGALFLTTLLAGVIPGRMSELPAKPPEMDAVTPLISSLTPDSVVLVVLDYQPGMTGELDAAAAGVLDHVMIQGARLALISTSPTGPALGERLVRQVEAVHGYDPGDQYVNLGYLPGAATGLQFLANAPASAVQVGYDARPFWSLVDQAGASPWAQPALQGVTGLGDFNLTLLLSDDPETIRRWVEQVGPFLRQDSLIVVASAQAVPLVRPYYDSGQVAALVSGLLGGAAYEGFLQREGPARAAWDGVGIGTLVAIVLILGAGAYNLYLVWAERELIRRGGS